MRILYVNQPLLEEHGAIFFLRQSINARMFYSLEKPLDTSFEHLFASHPSIDRQGHLGLSRIGGA